MDYNQTLRKIKSTLLRAKVRNTFVVSTCNPFEVFIVSLQLRAVVYIKDESKSPGLNPGQNLVSSIPFPAKEDWKLVEVKLTSTNFDDRLWKEIISNLSQSSSQEFPYKSNKETLSETRIKTKPLQEEILTYLNLLKLFLLEKFPQPAVVKALHVASARGRLDKVEILIKQGAEVEEKDLIFGCLPLHLATANGHLNIVKMLLDHKANVDAQNQKGETALHFAATTGQLEIAKVLVEHGADPNACNKKRRTPLHFSAANGHQYFVVILLDNRANIIARDYKSKTPLHFASANGHLDIVKILLEKRAYIHAFDKKRKTPLHLASEEGNLEVVKILLDHGAKTHLKDSNGRTPKEVASANGHFEIGKMIDLQSLSKPMN